MALIYKIIYPNNKIYIGSDLTDDINYFGSASSKFIAQEHPEMKVGDKFKITKEILWISNTATAYEVRKIENKFIIDYESNNPQKGYNQIPKYIAV